MPRQRTFTAKSTIVSRLTEGSATLSELRALTGLSASGVKSTISRLRDDAYRIMSESTSTAGDPRYTLLSGPGSLGPSFVCQACKLTIRLGHVEDHATFCQFGTSRLEKLLSKGPC